MSVKKNRYFVLLVDLIRSRLMQERGDATVRIKESINNFNRKARQDIYSPMEITRGDECAAVLHRITNAYDLVTAFVTDIHPFQCRFVLVAGTLTAGLESKRSTELDGPAFWDADQTMKKLKEQKK